MALVLVNAKILRIGLRVALDFFRHLLRSGSSASLIKTLGRCAQPYDTDQTDYSKDSNRLHGSNSHC